MSTYYERNKEKIKEKQKLRYRADSEYREQQKKRVADYKKRKSRERKELKELQRVERKVWRNFKIDGKIILCCRIGHLAEALNRTVQTIRLWEDKGLFPKSIRYKNHRYYTQPHYYMIIRVWKDSKGNLQKFFTDVFKHWNDV